MLALVDLTTRTVLMAGNNLTAEDIVQYSADWCAEYLPLPSYSIFTVTLPPGFLPLCWTYSSGGVWAVIPSEQDLVDGELARSRTVVAISSINITATDDSLIFNVDVSWGKVVTAQYYELRYRLAGGEYTTVVVPDSGALTTTTRLLGIKVNTTYYFSLRASTQWGMLEWSTELAQTTPSRLPPADVTSLNAVVNGRFIDVSWYGNPLYSYEVRLGATWDAGAVLVTNHKSSTVQITPKSTGGHTFWVKTIDSNGYYSTNAASAAVTVVPAVIPALSQQVIDNNVLLRWDLTPGTYPIDHTEIRRGNDFASADVVGTINGTFTAMFESSAGTYKYWAAPVDSVGLYGTEAGTYAVVNQPPDFVLHDQRPLTLAGTKTNCLLDGTTLLALINTAETFAGHFTANSYTSPQNQINAGLPYYLQPGKLTGSYVEVIDYGTTIPNTKISLAVTRTTIVGTVSITPTISVSANGTTWTDYAGVYEVYAVNFRYVKITLNFATSDHGLLMITGTNVKLDVKLKTIQGMANVVSTDAGGTAVDITGQFIDVQSVQVSPQGTVFAIAVYDIVDAPFPTSFKILLFNAAGAKISGPVSWTLRGV